MSFIPPIDVRGRFLSTYPFLYNHYLLGPSITYGNVFHNLKYQSIMSIKFHTRFSYSLSLSLSLMPHISRVQEDIHRYGCSSMDEQVPCQYGKLLPQMCNRTCMCVANGIYLVNDNNDFTIRQR